MELSAPVNMLKIFRIRKMLKFTCLTRGVALLFERSAPRNKSQVEMEDKNPLRLASGTFIHTRLWDVRFMGE